MSQYSSEFGSIIKQLRKISANTCAESEQMPYYEKEVCGTLPDVEGQTSQYTLIRVYTRDIDTGQIVLSHYEDILGNIINGTVVEACCDSAVCASPFSCNAIINSITSFEDALQAITMDITGSSTAGFMQIDVAGTILGPIASPWPTVFPAEITEAFRTGETTITLMIGNNIDFDLYCAFSFVTLTALNEDIKEDGDNPNWNPFPALVGGLGCTGTLTYTMILDTTGNGVTINNTTGDLTIPAGIYIEENSWVYVEVKCDGVLVAVTGLQLLNEALAPLVGLRLEWNDIVNSPFTDHTDLNAFITSNSGTSNYTSMVVENNTQVLLGGSNVDLGNDFMSSNANIVSILDNGLTVVEQGNNCQFNCAALVSITMDALVTQGEKNQNGNAVLTTISLAALTNQTGGKNKGNQSNNPLLTTITLPALTTQGAENQISNAALTAISLPLLTTQTSGNQNTNPLLTSLSMPALTTQTGGNQQTNASLVTLTLPSLITQEDGNQIGNAALTTFTANLLTSQTNDNLIGNSLLTTITTPLLTSIGTGNYTGGNYAAMTIDVDASLFGAPDILTAQAGGATII